MFKINKKVLVILIVILAVILVAGVLAYNKYVKSLPIEIENTAGGASITPEITTPKITTPEIQIEAEGVTGVGSLLICVEQCGDGVCTPGDVACPGGQESTNCVCPETKQDCPQDCK